MSQSVPRQIPFNLDLETGRGISNQLGSWIYGAILEPSSQDVSSDTSATVSENTPVVICDPAAVIAALTITLPSAAVDQDIVTILFGGQIDAGSAVVTALTMAAPTGQTLYGTAKTSASGGDALRYMYLADSKVWFRID